MGAFTAVPDRSGRGSRGCTPARAAGTGRPEPRGGAAARRRHTRARCRPHPQDRVPSWGCGPAGARVGDLRHPRLPLGQAGHRTPPAGSFQGLKDKSAPEVVQVSPMERHRETATSPRRRGGRPQGGAAGGARGGAGCAGARGAEPGQLPAGSRRRGRGLGSRRSRRGDPRVGDESVSGRREGEGDARPPPSFSAARLCPRPTSRLGSSSLFAAPQRWRRRRPMRMRPRGARGSRCL